MNDQPKVGIKYTYLLCTSMHWGVVTCLIAYLAIDGPSVRASLKLQAFSLAGACNSSIERHLSRVTWLKCTPFPSLGDQEKCDSHPALLVY